MSRDVNNNNNEDDHGPAWLSADYDEKHREETAPLFGTGTLDLHDPETPVGKNPVGNYGATTTTAATAVASANPKNGNENDNDSEAAASSKQRNRIGQNLLLRDDVLKSVPPDGSENNNNNKNNTNNKTKKKNKETIIIKNNNNKNDPEDPFGKSNIPSDPERLKPHVPPQNACLWMFHLLQGLATVAAICLLVTQLLPMFLVVHSSSDIIQRIGFLSLALKVYIILFCILFMLTEIGTPAIPLISSSQLLQNYGSRGFLYSFVGLICVEEAYSERVKNVLDRKQQTSSMIMMGISDFHVEWAAIFMEVSSWVMLGVGVIYMLLGICCMKRLRDRLQQKEKEAWAQYREDLKRWKELYT